MASRPRWVATPDNHGRAGGVHSGAVVASLGTRPTGGWGGARQGQYGARFGGPYSRFTHPPEPQASDGGWRQPNNRYPGYRIEAQRAVPSGRCREPLPGAGSTAVAPTPRVDARVETHRKRQHAVGASPRRPDEPRGHRGDPRAFAVLLHPLG